MMPLRCGEYAAEEAGRDLADLRAENDAVARRLATMSKAARSSGVRSSCVSPARACRSSARRACATDSCRRR